ncbi:amidase [Phenylobacterium sp.]|uniref:amidase n=1 Tax=Phenylobacterium sp. TaxID=1871053 RepID=UPI0035B23C5D
MQGESLNCDAIGLAELVRKREVTPGELVELFVGRIEDLNPTLNFMMSKAYDHGRREVGRGGNSILAGVPLLMKDIALSCAGVPCKSGSVFLNDYVPDHDSLIVQRLKAAGLIIIGTTTTPELGLSLESTNDLVGSCRNPWDLSRTPGGSSGGSGAAVAARVLPLAHATDGGGSIRVPASYCGLVGLKTSRGRVSFAPDVIDLWYGGITEGCVSISVRDTAAYADIIWGGLPGEPYEYPSPARPLLEEVGVDPGRLRVGVAMDAIAAIGVDPQVRQAVEATARLLQDLGHDVEEVAVDLAGMEFRQVYLRIIAVLTEMGIAGAEALFGRVARRDELRSTTWGFRDLAKGIGGAAHAADIEAMRRIGRDLCIACHPYDIVLTPTVPGLPTAVGDPDQGSADFEAHVSRLFHLMSFTAPVNVSGLPSISLPAGWSAEGLPIGVQAIARRGEEAMLIRLASQLEAARPWASRLPPVHA